VWTPVNPQLRYDLVIERSDGARVRVQVKMAWKDRLDAWRVDLTKKRRVGNVLVTKKYAKEDFDVLAVFNPDHRDFWIIPSQEIIDKTSIWCRTTKSKSKNQHSFDVTQYWQRWDIF
jgi:hypothetical protein